jgi:adenylate cyclase
MNTERAKRKLIAILSADVKGYSRLMGEDEVATVRTLKEYREVMSKLIHEYRGRVVDSPGDNLLAEFASVVDAVEAASEIQKDLKARNAELPEDRRMEFRIGINLGDVIEEGDRIYGDGVNIAARVESLAEGGGICISGTAYDQVENKLRVEYEYLGEQEAKNIARPVRVYRVTTESKETFFEPVGRLKLPDKPSIAVLPFVNMSDDKSQEYFSDGITEEIITALSKTPKLFVIARNSTFTYKGKPVKVQQVGRELGVKYVLEGSVRKAGDKVRITAQLLDAQTGQHLWAERYDREMRDIFAIQDEVTVRIIASVTGKTVSSEDEMRIRAKGASNLEAYLKCMEGKVLLESYNRDDIALARGRLEEAIALDPQWAHSHSLLSLVHVFDFRFTQNPESLKKAYESAQRAIGLDETQLYAHVALTTVYSFQRRYGEAIAEAEQCIKFAPGSADAYMAQGWSLFWPCRFKEALVYLETALRMNPFPPTHHFLQIGSAHLYLRNYEEAVPALKKALYVSPKNQLARFALIVAYVEMGRLEDAKREAREFLMMDPKWNSRDWLRTAPFKDPGVVQRWAEAIEKVGLEGRGSNHES